MSDSWEFYLFYVYFYLTHAMLKMAVKYNSIAPSEIRTPPNNGQTPRSQCVRYSEVPLYSTMSLVFFGFFLYFKNLSCKTLKIHHHSACHLHDLW